MALETGNFIGELVETNPTSSDPTGQGDDHIRLIKSILKSTFPNFGEAVTVTPAVLNLLNGLTVNGSALNEVTNKLDASAYTATDVRNKLLTVDGYSSGITVEDSKKFDGQSTSAFATAAQGTKADNALPSSSYTSTDVFNKVLSRDGSGSGLHADLLDGYHGSSFLRITQLDNELSDLTFNGLGMPVLAIHTGNENKSYGDIITGNVLKPASAGASSGAGTLPGTWRLLGRITGTGSTRVSLFQRIA